jgi:hypothetical protein
MFSPMLCVGLLAGLYSEKRGRVTAEDADPYHRTAKAAVEGLPYQLGGWIGRDEEVPNAAVKLLRPNIIVARTYINPSQPGRRAGFLVVQCRDSRDMLGHYPPICYPAQGRTQTVTLPRDWKIGDLTVHGMEYEFATTGELQPHRMVVYNFMTVPGVGIVRDMQGVGEAAADYQRRYFGATQVQVTFAAELSQPERDEIFKTLLGPNVPMLKTLISGGMTR